MRTKLFNHILGFRTAYFDHTPVGTLVTRSVSDLETVADIFSEGLIVIIGDLLTLFVIVGFMFYVDWRLTVISLGSIPILIIAANIFKNGIKEAFREVRTQVARLNAFVQEHITGMNIVQMFNREETEMKKFMEINELHKRALEYYDHGDLGKARALWNRMLEIDPSNKLAHTWLENTEEAYQRQAADRQTRKPDCLYHVHQPAVSSHTGAGR